LATINVPRSAARTAGQQHAFGGGNRYVIVVARLEAKRTRHAAATRVQQREIEAHAT